MTANGKHTRKRSGNLATEANRIATSDLLPFSFMGALLFVSAVAFDSSAGTLRSKGIILAIIFVALFFGNVFIWIRSGGIAACKALLCSNDGKWLLAVVAVAAAPRLFQLSIPLFWDSGLYYYGLSLAAQFNSSLGDLIHFAAIAYHPSEAYTFFLLPGYLLYPSGTEGVNLVRVIMYALSNLCVFAVFRRCFPRAGAFGAFMVSALVSVAPLGLGTFSALNLDWPLVVFLSYVLFALVYKRPVLLIVTSLCLVFSKEPGILLLIGVAGGYFAAQIVGIRIGNRRHVFSELRSALREDPCFIAFICSLVFAIVLYFFFSLFVSGWDSSSASGELAAGASGITARFGFDLEYILYRVLSLYVINFTWVYLVVIGAAIVVLIKQKHDVSQGFIREQRTTERFGRDASILIFCLLGALLLFSLFSLVYITFNNPRYSLPVEFLLILLASSLALPAITTLKARSARAAVTIVGGIFVAALFVQAFTTIDPLTKLVGVSVPCGPKGFAISIPQKANAFFKSESEKVIVYNNGGPDMAVYNNQLLSRGRVMDELLASYNYDGSQDIIVWNNQYMSSFSFSLDGGLVLGGKSNGHLSLGLEWCPEQRKRVLPGTADSIPLNIVNSDDYEGLLETGDLREQALLIIDPFTMRTIDGANVSDWEQIDQTIDDILDLLGEHYAISDPVWITSSYQYGMCYYKLTELADEAK